MSRTIRYFKLVYIVAGILLSNEKICQTVDQIQITPRFTQPAEMQKQFKQSQATKALMQQHTEMNKKTSNCSNWWYQKFYVFQLLTRIRSHLRAQWKLFSVWNLTNLIIECLTSLLCRTFIINSDCDVIYK